MSIFRNMEAQGKIEKRQELLLSKFCVVMSHALADMVRSISPGITPRDVSELPLITLGSQFQGGNNNIIGQAATKGMFTTIANIFEDIITTQNNSEFEIGTPHTEKYIFALASDPDLSVQKILLNGRRKNILSIEIKGGTDKSNAYNRGGEAEKSHQSAKKSRVYRMLDSNKYCEY